MWLRVDKNNSMLRVDGCECFQSAFHLLCGALSTHDDYITIDVLLQLTEMLN